MNQPSGRLHHLDGIRGIAALGVVIAHSVWPNHIKFYGFVSAGLWVDFFFVLSGFVIAYNYQEKLAKGFGVGTYMWKRLARIYPAHFVVLILLLGYEILKYATQSSAGFESNQVAFENNNLGSFLASLALIQAMGLYDGSPWNGPSWSISTEVWTYLVFGLAFAWFKLHGRAVVLFTIAVILLSYAAVLTNPDHEYLSVETDYGFFRCLIGFGMGVLVFNAYRIAEERDAGTGVQSMQLALMAMVFVVIALRVNNTAYTLLAPPVFAALVYSLSVRRRGLLERLLMLRPIQFLGVISYSLYISHTVIRRFVMTAHRFIAPRLDAYLTPEQVGDILTLLYIPTTLVFGWLVWRLVEVPANAWLVARIPSKRKRRPEDAAGADPAF